jgi:hypothetical protein
MKGKKALKNFQEKKLLGLIHTWLEGSRTSHVLESYIYSLFLFSFWVWFANEQFQGLKKNGFVVNHHLNVGDPI